MSSGIVSIEDDQVVLNDESFIPSDNLEEKSFFFGMNIADHLNAINHNLTSDEIGHFERCVYYDGLSETAVYELEKLSAEEGMKVIKKINKFKRIC